MKVGIYQRKHHRKGEAASPLQLLYEATLVYSEGAVSTAYKCKTKGVVIPDAGFGMDMDLPEDYERLKAYVMERKGIKAD